MRETHNEATRLEQSISTHKDNIQGYNKAIDHVQNHNAEYSKDMTQDVINAYKKTYGVGDREAGLAVLDGDASAQRIFRQISGVKANDILQQVRSAGAELKSSNNVSEFLNKNQDAVQNNVGNSDGAVSKFAQEKGMTHESTVVNDINKTGENLKEDHSRKLQQKTDGYQGARNTNQLNQQSRQAEIDQLEKNRIGKGYLGTLGGNINGVGRPEPTEFKTEYKDESVMPTLKAIRPNTEFTSQDATDTRDLMQEFNSDNSITRDDTSIAKGSHQYVDPTKKTKS
jgi:hypothetical protein